VQARPNLLSRYVENPKDAAGFPPNWAEIFSRQTALKVEVGFGGGEYLAWWASHEPQSNFVGIELPHEGIVKACRALGSVEKSNVRLVRGDARYLLRELFAPGTVSKVMMQFPMPWPKEKHAKHRVSNPRFTATLADILEIGGQYELVTDQEWYAREAWTHFQSDASFSLGALEQDPERPFRTRYESKWLEQGRSIFRFVATLETPRSAPRIITSSKMHHTHIDNEISAAEIRALGGRRFSARASSAEIKEVLQGETSWLLKVVVADESFSQFFGLRLVDRGEDRWLLKVDDYPRPYPTPAVRFVIDEVAAALAGVAVR
jgi:tRNA (guanine-N7-)-methyltransferase